MKPAEEDVARSAAGLGENKRRTVILGPLRVLWWVVREMEDQTVAGVQAGQEETRADSKGRMSLILRSSRKVDTDFIDVRLMR